MFCCCYFYYFFSVSIHRKEKIQLNLCRLPDSFFFYVRERVKSPRIHFLTSCHPKILLFHPLFRKSHLVCNIKVPDFKVLLILNYVIMAIHLFVFKSVGFMYFTVTLYPNTMGTTQDSVIIETFDRADVITPYCQVVFIKRDLLAFFS